MSALLRRRFSGFVKAGRCPDAIEFQQIKKKLLGSKWQLEDDCVSAFPSKQLHVALQSVLEPDSSTFMSRFNNKMGPQDLDQRFRRGLAIPFGYELIYCNPLSSERELNSDGFDSYHSPSLGQNDFFRRRMWVGGQLLYNSVNRLVYGEPLRLTETVERIKGLKNNNLIFMDYKRSFENETGWAAQETRRLCYIQDSYQPIQGATIDAKPDDSVVVKPSEISGFRMSALIFNSHLIHYNGNYAANEEKYPALVLEAPLLLELILQYWRSRVGQSHPVHSIKYKIPSPSFVGDEIRLCIAKQNDTRWRLWIQKTSDSVVCFDSTLQTVAD